MALEAPWEPAAYPKGGSGRMPFSNLQMRTCAVSGYGRDRESRIRSVLS